MTEASMAGSFAVTDGPRRHLAYTELAANGPVHRVTLPDGAQAWLITGYDQARHALLDPRLNQR